MSILDVFKNDSFSVISLTTAIDKVPYIPQRIGQMGLFRSIGVPTTSVMIEERHGQLSLIPTRARGTMPTFDTTPKRQGRSFAIPHIPKNDSLMADDVQNVRAFGSESRMEGIAEMVAQKLQYLRNDHEVTWEWHRLGALKGQVLDADGSSVVYNWFTEFGITPTTQNFSQADADAYKTGFATIERHIADSLGGSSYTQIAALCGRTFWDNMVNSAEVKTAHERYLDGKFLRDNHTFGKFEYAGVQLEEYRGSLGATKFIADNKAYFFPIGVPDLFLRFNGPGTFLEAVNTVGRPVYVKQKTNDWGTGVDIHTQSNPLFICTRPSVLVEATTVA